MSPTDHTELLEAPDGRFSSFLAYPGIGEVSFHSGTNHIPVLIDVLLAGMIIMLLWINVIASPHPIAWFVALLAVVQGALLFLRPANIDRLRILGLAIACLSLAVLQPWRTGQHVMAFSYVAMFGLVALFLIKGTIPTLLAATGYIVYAGYLQWLDPTFTAVDAWSSMAGMGASCLVLIVLIHHFLIKLDKSNRALKASLNALQVSFEDLQYAATAGNLGLYECNLTTGNWRLNSVMRTALELPEDRYPTVKTQDLVERSDDHVHALGFGGSTLEAPDVEYLDFQLHQFRLPSGRLLHSKINSRFSTDEEGTRVRHGIVIFHPEMAL